MNEPKDGKRWFCGDKVWGYVSAPLVEAFVSDLMAVCAKHKMVVVGDSQCCLEIHSSPEGMDDDLRFASIGDIELVPATERPPPAKAKEYVDVRTILADGTILSERVKL